MICLEEQKEVTASVDLEVVEETVQDDDGEISKVLCKQMSRVSRNSLGVTRSATAKCWEEMGLILGTNHVIARDINSIIYCRYVSRATLIV